MSIIMLGNLSVKEVEERLGITFNDELKKLINEENRQHKVSDRRKDDVKWEKDWHCFDIPFMIMLRNYDLAVKVKDLLDKESHKRTIQISWHED